MISMECDYIAGAHPDILKALERTNMEHLPGYGTDHYTESAKDKIRRACGADVEVEFLIGGTQTNAAVIGIMLRDYEGVIAADTGHISVHESGAIESGGHKVLTLEGHQGKLDAGSVRAFMESFYSNPTHEHMVFPGMVYISHPTELGTLYKKAELEALADVCHDYGIPLYLDGARLGYGLESRESDMTLGDIARICDVFYIGGTKVGALCGEAVVFSRDCMPEHFMTSIKKRGALLAKGRLLGIQFDTLFTDDLYFRISRHAIDKAEELKALIREKGWEFYLDSPTNQQFVLFDEPTMDRVRQKIGFDIWDRYDDNRWIVRFTTSWSTTDEELQTLRDL